MTLRIALLTAAAAIWAPSAIQIAALAGPREHGGDDAGSGTDGAPGSPAEVNRIVRVEALDQRFNVNRIQVRSGETVKFLITSKSSIPHEFVIASHEEHLEHRKMMQRMPDMKMDEEPNAITIDPGETKELIWRFGKDQDVEFACDIPGHAEQGMAGKFRVTK
jgi:uncharacterized cupredoxin-like copper-binding protein